MKKLTILLILILLLGSFSLVNAQLSVVWERNAAQGNLPGWFDTNDFTRGFSYGEVNGNDRLYVVSRNGGNFIYILNATTGDSVGVLDNTGITGGTYLISDAGVSDDGKIYVCNLSINSTFKVYVWDTEVSAPAVAVSHIHSGRLGDKFTVTGSTLDNSIEIYAASANSNEVLLFTTSDNGATFVADTISIDATGGSASVGPLSDGSFYWNAGGDNPNKYSSAGSLLGTIPGSVVATGSNAIRYITSTGDYEYFATFQYGTGNENARIVRSLTSAIDNATTYTITPSMRVNSNGNGTGDVSVKDNGDGTFNVYVLSTNNGLGAYTVEFPVEPQAPVNMFSNYEVHVGDVGFFQNDHNTRGMTYNVATDHVLVASRTGGAYIYVLDQGVVIDTLDMTGVSGGTYPLNMVVADTNGVIYAGNLALAGGNYKMYRWADEQAVPTVAFDGTVAQRAGDVLALSGTGTSTILYASGSGATEIQLFTTADGINFTAQTPITIAGGTARGGISPVMNSVSSDLWINGAGTTVRKIDSAGNIITEISGGVIAGSWMNVQYMEADNGARMITVNANNISGDRRKVQVWDVTDENNPALWANGETFNIENSNANGSGSLSFKNQGMNIQLLQLTTNNAIASWALDIPVVTTVIPIAQAKAYLDSVHTIQGVITTPNYSGTNTQYYLQDTTGGLQMYLSGANLAFSPGDELEVTGEVRLYNGLSCIYPASASDIVLVNSGVNVDPENITIADIGEPYEAVLVKVDSVWFVDPSQWPSTGSNGSVDVTDGLDTTYIYIDRDTDLDGWTPPQGLMNIIAICDEYNGYSLRGTFREDFIDLTQPAPAYYPPTNVLATNYRSGALVQWDLLKPSTQLSHNNGNVTSGFYQDPLQGYGCVFDISQIPVSDLEMIEFNHFGFNFLAGPYYFTLYVYDWGDSLIAQFDSLEARDAFSVPVWELIDVGSLNTNGVDSLGIFIQGLTIDNFGDGWPTVTTDDVTPPVAGGQWIIQDLANPFTTAAVGNTSLGSFLINAYLFTGSEKIVLANSDTNVKVSDKLQLSEKGRGSIPGHFSKISPLSGFNIEQYVLTSFKVYRGADSQSLTEIASVDPSNYFYYDDMAPQDSTYYYGVSAAYSDSESVIITVQYYQPNLPNVALLPDSLDFGEIAINGNASLNFQIINSGLGDLSVDSIRFGTTYFISSVAGDTSVLADDTLDVTVTFLPAIEDTINDVLTIYTNIDMFEVSLTGSGYILWPLNWRIAADTAAWMGSSANAPRSIAYSRDYNHIYFVAHPGGVGDFVKSFDAETGDFVKDLDLSALIGGGFISISAIAATPDGQIFASNLSSDAGSFNLYHWANEDAPMSLVFSAPLGKRSGDALSAIGTGLDAKVFTSGFGNDSVFVFGTTDGVTFELESSVVLPAASAARQGIGPVDDTYMFINSSAAPPRYMKTDGTVLYTFDTATISSGTAINYFEVRVPAGLRRFVGITNAWSSGTTVVELLGTPGDNLCSSIQVVEAPTDNYSTFANGNASGNAIYSSVDNALVELITNNGVSAYSMDIVVPDAIKDTVTTITSNEDFIPKEFSLSQNYPNPFNPTTSIDIALPVVNEVEMDIFNILGQKVKTISFGKLNAGVHKIDFDASQFSSGVYFYMVRAGEFREVKKMVLMK